MSQRIDREVETQKNEVEVADHLVVFRLDDQRYALALSDVQKVLPVMAVTKLPDAPPIILGMVNLEGQLTPVVAMRLRFGHAARPRHLSEQLLVARARKLTVALLVDEVLGVEAASPKQITTGHELLPHFQFEGALKCPDGLVLIHDLKRLLDSEQERYLELALTENAPVQNPGSARHER